MCIINNITNELKIINLDYLSVFDFDLDRFRRIQIFD